MITKLNLGRIEEEGFDYILGVKHRQDEMGAMLLATEDWGAGSYETHQGLKIKERRVRVKDFLGKLIKYKVRFSQREERTQIIPKVTMTTPLQKKYFNLVGIRNSMSLERFVW